MAAEPRVVCNWDTLEQRILLNWRARQAENPTGTEPILLVDVGSAVYNILLTKFENLQHVLYVEADDGLRYTSDHLNGTLLVTATYEASIVEGRRLISALVGCRYSRLKSYRTVTCRNRTYGLLVFDVRLRYPKPEHVR